MAAAHANKQDRLAPPSGEIGDNGNLVQPNYQDVSRQNHARRRGEVTHSDNPNVNNNCNYASPNHFQATETSSYFDHDLPTQTILGNQNR